MDVFSLYIWDVYKKSGEKDRMRRYGVQFTNSIEYLNNNHSCFAIFVVGLCCTHIADPDEMFDPTKKTAEKGRARRRRVIAGVRGTMTLDILLY